MQLSTRCDTSSLASRQFFSVVETLNIHWKSSGLYCLWACNHHGQIWQLCAEQLRAVRGFWQCAGPRQSLHTPSQESREWYTIVPRFHLGTWTDFVCVEVLRLSQPSWPGGGGGGGGVGEGSCRARSVYLTTLLLQA